MPAGADAVIRFEETSEYITGSAGPKNLETEDEVWLYSPVSESVKDCCLSF